MKIEPIFTQDPGKVTGLPGVRAEELFNRIVVPRVNALDLFSEQALEVDVDGAAAAASQRRQADTEATRERSLERTRSNDAFLQEQGVDPASGFDDDFRFERSSPSPLGRSSSDPFGESPSDDFEVSLPPARPAVLDGSVLPPLDDLPPSRAPSAARGDFAFRAEARLDKAGRLKEYNSPGSDKNNKEIAGFGDVTSGSKYRILKNLLDSGDTRGAEAKAKEFLSERGSVFTSRVQKDNVADILNGVVHHRGEGGFRKIAELVGVSGAAGTLGPQLEREAAKEGFSDRWIAARAKQERENEASVWRSKGRPGSLAEFRKTRRAELGGSASVPGLGSFPKGLYNRWKREANSLINN